MKTARWLRSLIFGALLVSSVAPVLAAEAGEAPSPTPLDGAEIVDMAPPQVCDAALGAGGLDLRASMGGASPLLGRSFYVCLSNDFFCGGPCPDGKHCATEACGSMFAPACTFDAACVGGCQVTPSCQTLAESCPL